MLQPTDLEILGNEENSFQGGRQPEREMEEISRMH